MKKLLTFILTATALQAQADDYIYKYLVMTDVQGKQTALSTNGLKMTIDDGKLTIINNEGVPKTFFLASLASMTFAETADDTTTAIEATPANNDEQGRLEVYTLGGMLIATLDNLPQLKSTLGAGIYIVKQNGITKKITIK